MTILMTAMLFFATGSDSAEYVRLIKNAENLSSTNQQKAIAYTDSAKQLFPIDPTAFFWAGIIYLNNFQPNASYYEFQRGFDLLRNKSEMMDILSEKFYQFPNKQDSAQFSIGFEFIEQGKANEAVIHFRKMLKKYPHHPKILYELGYALIEKNEIHEAIGVLENGRKVAPYDTKILSELKYCYAEIGDIPNIKNVVNELLKYDGDSPGLYQELAFAYAKNGERTHAVSAFEYNIINFPEYVYTYYSYGQYLYDLDEPKIKDKDKIIGLLQKFIELANKKDNKWNLKNVNPVDFIPEAKKMINNLKGAEE